MLEYEVITREEQKQEVSSTIVINYFENREVISRALVSDEKRIPQHGNFIKIEGGWYKVLNFYYKNPELSEMDIILQKQTVSRYWKKD